MEISGLKRVLSKRSEKRKSFIRVFDTDEGRIVLADLCREAGVTRPRLHTDTNKAMIMQGQQAVVHYILRMLNSKPEDMIRKIEEEIHNE